MRIFIIIAVICSTILYSCGNSSVTVNYPPFTFMDTDSNIVAAKDIPKDKGLLLVYFRSDCEHCHHAAQMMKEYVKSYKVNVWMVTGEDMEMTRMFEDMSGLYEINNLKILRDYEHNMHTWFEFTALPYIVLFDKNGKQLQVFKDLPEPKQVDSALGVTIES